MLELVAPSDVCDREWRLALGRQHGRVLFRGEDDDGDGHARQDGRDDEHGDGHALPVTLVGSMRGSQVLQNEQVLKECASILCRSLELFLNIIYYYKYNLSLHTQALVHVLNTPSTSSQYLANKFCKVSPEQKQQH